MYRLAVCEDEAESRERLCALCGEILDSLAVEHDVTAFPSAAKLEHALTSGERFDLLCLDIYMEGRTGMELARSLREWDDETSIIFITSSREHLKDGYKARPLEYLYKPVRWEELEAALRTDLRLHRKPETVTVSRGGKTAMLPLDDIFYIESRNHDSVVFLSGDSRRYRLSLSEMERFLPTDYFCRCHNSFLANMAHIKEITWRGLELDDGRQIPVGRSYYRDAKTKLDRYHNRRKR